jgi:Glycosyl transferases group 1
LWEGMPLSVLQALASGLPCVVTDVVGNRDAVQQGITGYVARHPEALAMCVRRLLVDAALYARMSRAARADALERFTGRNLRLRLFRLYGLPEMQGLGAGEPVSMAFDDRDAGLNVAVASGSWRSAAHGSQAGVVS